MVNLNNLLGPARSTLGGSATRLAIAGMFGGAAVMAGTGIMSAVGAPTVEGDPFTSYNMVNTARTAGYGGAAGAGAGALLGRMRGGGRNALIGAAIGAGVGAIGGAMFGAWRGGKVREGAFTGGQQGMTMPQTRMSRSLANITQLRADIARLSRPIKGSGW